MNRKYELKKRAQRQEQTRQRIIEAARSHLTGAECVLPIAVPFQRRDRRLP